METQAGPHGKGSGVTGCGKSAAGEAPVRLAGCLGILLGMMLAAPAHAQQYLSIPRRPVTVWATVHDRHGDPVANLTQDDFELSEDGIRQTVSRFSAQCDFPLTLGLLVDTSPAQERLLEKARMATSTFLGSMLRPDRDRGFLIHYDKDVELFRGLTSSLDSLESGLASLAAPAAVQTSSGANRWHGAALYDAVFLAANDVMKQQQGRKVLILLSDGVDHGSKETLENAIWAAQRADVVIYSVLLEDDDELYANSAPLGWEMSRRRMQRQAMPQVDGEEVLRVISDETGGHMFEVSWRHPAEQIYTRIEDDLRSQYIITYVPDRDYVGPGYHKIHLATRRNDVAVQARDGYYAWR